jgi:hypothetical protein
MSNGIFMKLGMLPFSGGYYTQKSVMLTLANCFLLRIKSIEQLSHENPGELGKAIGYDRIPEVKTLRRKCAELGSEGSSKMWAAELSKYWMEENPDLAGIFYIDGHENPYFGKNSKIPRRYFSRLRLAIRGTTDYWVNDQLGQPFFSISKTINPGMIQVLKEDIVPRLMKDVPKQPTQQELEKDLKLHRFMCVYDREGYSDDFMLDMWEGRIACCTYKKYVNDKWDESEFIEYEVLDENKKIKEKLKLAERAIFIQGKESVTLEQPKPVFKFKELNDKAGATKISFKKTEKKRGMWVREIRRLSENGHQTSIITSNYQLTTLLVGLFMFARWRQENFFKYMVHHLGLDFIISYFKNTIPETEIVINPLWRQIDKQVKSKMAFLKRMVTKFGKMTLEGIENGEDTKKYQNQKAKLQEDISISKQELEDLKNKRSGINRKIMMSELPEKDQFMEIYTDSKHLIDTIKLIVFRSEMALVNTVKDFMSKKDEGHSFMTEVYKTSADLHVDYQSNVLEVRFHHLSTAKKDEVLKKLCDELNLTETIFPDTNLRIVYKLLSD